MGMRTDKTKVEMFECNTQPHFFKNKCLKARGQAQQWKSDDLGFFSAATALALSPSRE